MRPRWGALFAIWLAVTGARAQEAEAASLFRAGTAAYERGDYMAAAVAFEDAHRHAPRAATLYNAALAWQAAGEPVRAADAFEACMKLGGLEPSSLEDARARLHALEAELGIIHVTGPAGYVASVAHVENASLPRLVHVRPGTYDVRARAPDGRTFTRVAVAQPGLGVEVAFTPPSPPPSEPARSPEPQRTIGWVTAGTGGALGVVTAVLGFSALAARDRFAASGYTDADARADASTLRTWTNVTLVAAAVCVVGGVAIALTAPKRPSPRAAAAF